MGGYTNAFATAETQEVEQSEVAKKAATLGIEPFTPEWEREEELRKQLLEERKRMQNMLAEGDDRKKLDEIYARYRPQPAKGVMLDQASHEALKGTPACISEEGMNREGAEALHRVFAQHLPNTKIEFIPVKTPSGEERFAYKGISADEANAIVKMHYIKSMAEAVERGEDVKIQNADKMTTAELDRAVAEMEIARAAKEKAKTVSQEVEKQHGQTLDLAALAAKVNELSGRSNAPVKDDSIVVTPKGLERVASMAAPAPNNDRDDSRPVAASTPALQRDAEPIIQPRR